NGARSFFIRRDAGDGYPWFGDEWSDLVSVFIDWQSYDADLDHVCIQQLQYAVGIAFAPLETHLRIRGVKSCNAGRHGQVAYARRAAYAQCAAQTLIEFADFPGRVLDQPHDLLRTLVERMAGFGQAQMFVAALYELYAEFFFQCFQLQA